MKSLLDELINNQWECGELVIFKYVDWLKTNLVDYLGLRESLTLDGEPIDFESELWDQGVSWDHEADWQSMQNAIPMLRSYNSHEGKRIFDQQYHCCLICDHEGCGQTDFTQISTCAHFTCNECIASIINVNLSSGQLASIKCPTLGCKQLLDLSIIRKYVSSDQDYNRYQDYLKQQRGLVKCLRCPDGWSFVDNLTRSTFCSTCYYSFCLFCRNQFHPGVNCDDNNAKRGDNNNRIDRNNPTGLGLIRICPTCGCLITKSEGCNKMTCSNCSTRFCWLCLKANIDYNHFGLRCELFQFTPSRINHANRIVNSGVVDATTVCRCKQLLYRHSGSNTVVCRNCDATYCFLCKTKIKGTRHFMNSDTCTQNGNPKTFKPDKSYVFYNLSNNETITPEIKSKKDYYIFEGLIIKR